MNNNLNWYWETLDESVLWDDRVSPNIIDTTYVKFNSVSKLPHNNVYCNVEFKSGNIYEWGIDILNIPSTNDLTIGIGHYNLKRKHFVSKFGVKIYNYDRKYERNGEWVIETNVKIIRKFDKILNRRTISKSNESLFILLSYDTLENKIEAVVNGETIDACDLPFNCNDFDEDSIIVPIVTSEFANIEFRLIHTDIIPYSLQSYCRKTILSLLVTKSTINELPIPNTLKNYLNNK